MSLKMEDAMGMTVNERLGAAGLMSRFDDALRHRDEAQLRDLLAAVYLDAVKIRLILAQIHSPGWAVAIETARRFAPSDWVEATQIIEGVVLPLIDQAPRQTGRARVQLAMIKISAGDIIELRRAARQATTDWRDVLVAAGLADGNWRETLVAEGYAVPGGMESQ
jgi:hypothetical protein